MTVATDPLLVIEYTYNIYLNIKSKLSKEDCLNLYRSLVNDEYKIVLSYIDSQCLTVLSLLL